MPLQDVKESKDYHFPAEEESVLAYWDEIGAFKEQLRRTEGRPEYIFYDGPPFATGLPHYGHILAGTLKVGRWAAWAALQQRRIAAPGGRRMLAPAGAAASAHGWARPPPPAGHCDAVRQQHGAPRHAPLWVGLPWPAGRV